MIYVRLFAAWKQLVHDDRVAKFDFTVHQMPDVSSDSPGIWNGKVAVFYIVLLILRLDMFCLTLTDSMLLQQLTTAACWEILLLNHD